MIFQCERTTTIITEILRIKIIIPNLLSRLTGALHDINDDLYPPRMGMFDVFVGNVMLMCVHDPFEEPDENT